MAGLSPYATRSSESDAKESKNGTGEAAKTDRTDGPDNRQGRDSVCAVGSHV